MNNYPEHEKLQKVKEASQVVGEFLDWLTSTRKITLCEWSKPTPGWKDSELVPCYRPFQDFLAEYFGIDQDKLENEKQDMLESFRNRVRP